MIDTVSKARQPRAWRLFIMLVALIMVPVSTTLWFAYSAVERQARQGANERLLDSAKTYALNALGRLEFATDDSVERYSTDPKAFGLSVDSQRSTAGPMIGEVYVRDLNIPTGAMETAPTITLVEAESDQLNLAVVMPRSLNVGEPQQVVATIRPDYLWGSVETSPSGLSFCVTSGVQLVHCPDPLLSARAAELADQASSHAAAYRLAGEDGASRLVAHWSLFLGDQGVEQTLKIFVAQDEKQALASATALRRSMPGVFLLTGVLAIWFARLLINRRRRPLEILASAASKLSDGDFDSTIQVSTNDEFDHLATAFNQMRHRLRQQFSALTALAGIDAMILESCSLALIAEHAAEKLASLVSSHTASVTLVDRDALNQGRTYLCSDSDLTLSRSALPAALMDHLAGSWNGFNHDAVSSHLTGYPWPFDEDTQCFIYPIRHADACIGFIRVLASKDSDIQDHERKAAQEFADRIAVAANNLEQGEQLRALGYFDALTGLPNRNLFQEKLEEVILNTDDDSPGGALLFIDLDGFKRVNDSEGHRAGDQLLAEVAKRLEHEIGDQGILSRLGGDEFTIVMENARNPDHVEATAGRILEAIRQPFVVDQLEHYITGAIGISLFPKDGKDAHSLLRKADTAMYSGKREGGDQLVFYETQMQADIEQQVRLDSDLRRSIAADELELHYQPKVDLDSGHIIGAEALLRWNHPHNGQMLPDQFIYLAEKSGFIIEMGEWALRQACRDFKSMLALSPQFKSLAVNVSLRQLMEDEFPAMVTEIVRDAGLPPNALQIEVTESMLSENLDRVADNLNQLRQSGISIAVDDFGTGYSSLSYLRKLPLDAIKIDRSFIVDVPHNEEATVLARGLLDLACRLGKDVIVEGVESIEQHRFLMDKGGLIAQGYLYGRACHIEAWTRVTHGARWLGIERTKRRAGTGRRTATSPEPELAASTVDD